MGHLLTFGGHPAACAAALKNLEIFEREDLVGQSADKGDYSKSRLEELSAHPTVGDVRGLGLYLRSRSRQEQGDPRELGQVRPSPTGLESCSWNADSSRASGMFCTLLRRWLPRREEIDRMVEIADESLTVAEREFASDIVA